jgi:hypothetical protein
MKQPGGLGTPHPLWVPRDLKDIPPQILAWRKNVAKQDNLPELYELLPWLYEQEAEEGEDMPADKVGEGGEMSRGEGGEGADVPRVDDGQGDAMAGVEIGQAEGLSEEPAVELDGNDRLVKRQKLV